MVGRFQGSRREGSLQPFGRRPDDLKDSGFAQRVRRRAQSSNVVIPDLMRDPFLGAEGSVRLRRDDGGPPDRSRSATWNGPRLEAGMTKLSRCRQDERKNIPDRPDPPWKQGPLKDDRLVLRRPVTTSAAASNDTSPSVALAMRTKADSTGPRTNQWTCDTL